jgi:O-antigen ligase
MAAIFNKTRIQQFIYASAWMLCFSIPLPYWSARVVFFSSILFLLWLIEGDFRNKFYQLRAQKLFLILMVFLGYNILSLLWTDYFRVGLETLKPYKYYLLIIPPLITSIPKEKIPGLIFAFILGVLIHAAVAYIGMFFDITVVLSKKIYDPYAIYGPFTAFCALYFLSKVLRTDKSIHGKVIYLAIFIVLFILLFIKPGRSGQIGFMVSIGALVFLSYGSTLKTFVYSTIAIFIILFVTLNIESTRQKYNDAVNELKGVFLKEDYGGQWGARVGFLMSSIDIAKQNPMFGVGIGDSRDALQRLYERGKNRGYYSISFYDGPHNQYLTFLTKLGLVGLSLFMIYIVVFFRLDIKNVELKNLSIVFIVMFCFNCLADEIMFMKPYNIYFAVMSALFINASSPARYLQTA